ncbi:hypothetical protein M514_24725 [Trichuris suis]|uniref:Uncharacterized protein n=1 Tax=Trichuris suis TaxID=68888 RepID=A0A085N0Z2_9BILA|nr:hypothetical protein M514_24725 [Trichuris suis]
MYAESESRKKIICFNSVWNPSEHIFTIRSVLVVGPAEHGLNNRKIASTTTAHNHAYIVTGVGFGPTPTEVDCGLNAAPWTARPSILTHLSFGINSDKKITVLKRIPVAFIGEPQMLKESRSHIQLARSEIVEAKYGVDIIDQCGRDVVYHHQQKMAHRCLLNRVRNGYDKRPYHLSNDNGTAPT